MCLYGPHHLARDSIDVPADPVAEDEQDDLEAGEVLPVGDPRLELEAAV